MTTFFSYIFKLFPPYFKKADTYKNSNGEGLFERYLQVYGLELDTEVKPFIDNVFNVLNIQTCPDRFLTHIAGNLGYMPYFQPVAGVGYQMTNVDTYRKLLAYAIKIYQCKGTKKAFKIIYNILGYNIDIIEIEPKEKWRYDNDNIYDDSPLPGLYDSECEFCTEFYIAIAPKYKYINRTIFSNNVPDTFSPPPALIQLSEQIVAFLAPITTKYKGLIALGLTETETFDIQLTDTLI